MDVYPGKQSDQLTIAMKRNHKLMVSAVMSRVSALTFNVYTYMFPFLNVFERWMCMCVCSIL